MKLDCEICRHDFEQWYSDEGKNPKSVEKNNSGEYQLMQAQISWIAWAACFLSDKGAAR